MAKFVIAPHMRLHEWVARDKGYFRREGLDYELRDQLASSTGRVHDLGDRVGAYQTIERGRDSDISCACHWTVNVAASVGHGKLYPHAYSVAPAAIFVPPESKINHPAELAGVPISVGYQSGSHYSTIQALEQYLLPDQISLSFADGLLFRRMELLIDRQVPAASLFSGPYYFAEQLGFRKIIDSTFMMASLITGDPDPEDVQKYFRALRLAQRDIDLRPELFTRYYQEEFPPRFRDMIDTGRWGPGERIVFEPYTRETFAASRDWIAAHGIFSESEMGNVVYEEAVLPVPADRSVVAT
jgi:NitT/TauT family transport system substrate-binding protein